MATTASFPRLHSKGKEYCAKLARLVAEGGTDALMKVFNQTHSPHTISTSLKSLSRVLQALLARGVITRAQWDALFPPSGEPASSKHFGIKLLTVLIQNVCGVVPPAKGWASKPRRGDTSEQANIIRVTSYFSDIYEHASSRDIDVFHYFDYWNRITRTLLALGISRSEVEYLQTAPIDADKYLQVLFNWVVLGQEPCVPAATSGKERIEKSQTRNQDKLLGSILKKQERISVREKKRTLRKENAARKYGLTHKTNKGNGTVSQGALESERWYFGRIATTEAEKRLLSGNYPPGTFIIRESEIIQENYFLSVLRGKVVRHYKIYRSETGENRFYIPPRQPATEPARFNTLSELVKHYSLALDGLCCRLTVPCSREDEERDPHCDGGEQKKSPLSSVQLHNLLYKHKFGHVCTGTWKGTVDVAVQIRPEKTITSSASSEVFDIMTQLSHKHIVKLFAVYTNSKPFYIVTEPLKSGRLLDYLMSRTGRSAGLIQRTDMAAQIADAMMYLGQNSIIHRDLGARSVVISERGTCKICHFELAKFAKGGEYIPRKNSEQSFTCPVRWTDPQCIVHGRFTDKSDVWSFGVFLMELVTHGAIPYREMADCKVFDMVRLGYRMPRPPNCPIALYDLMLSCWEEDERQRKNFAELHLFLRSHFCFQH